MTRPPEIDLTSDADLADLLRHVLDEAGLSTRDVERRGGPSHSTVGRMLSGERLDRVRAYLLALEVAGYRLVITARLGEE